MTVHVEVAPDLLLWAVGRAGWDRETIERKVPRFNEWVDGTRQPTLRQLESFAQATYTPFGMLFLPAPPEEELPIADLRTIGNNRLERPSANLLDTIYACQNRQEWYREYADINGFEPLDFVGSAELSDDPMAVAKEIRHHLRFDLGNRTSYSSWIDARAELIGRIEALGVLVMVNGIVGTNTHRKLDPEEFRGFALADDLAPLIFVNGADTRAAQNFTLVHELAHIWLGSSAVSDASMTIRHKEGEERWCNQVAAEVLVPGKELEKDFSSPVDTALLTKLSRKYKVSSLAVLKRIFDSGLISWDEYQELYSNELDRVLKFMDGRSDKPSGGDFYNTQKIRLGELFSEAVISSAYSGRTSFRDAYKLVGVKTHDSFEKFASKLGAS